MEIKSKNKAEREIEKWMLLEIIRNSSKNKEKLKNLNMTDVFQNSWKDFKKLIFLFLEFSLKGN